MLTMKRKWWSSRKICFWSNKERGSWLWTTNQSIMTVSTTVDCMNIHLRLSKLNVGRKKDSRKGYRSSKPPIGRKVKSRLKPKWSSNSLKRKKVLYSNKWPLLKPALKSLSMKSPVWKNSPAFCKQKCRLSKSNRKSKSRKSMRFRHKYHIKNKKSQS